jgi:hypothetical protein
MVSIRELKIIFLPHIKIATHIPASWDSMLVPGKMVVQYVVFVFHTKKLKVQISEKV